MRKETEQEIFWKSIFGDEYIKRNGGRTVLAAKISAFTHYLRRAHDIKTTLEFGGNIGMNERALQHLIPDVKMDVVEINAKAADECRKIENVNVFTESIYDFETEKTYDLTFTNGVMIHLNPEYLPTVYNKLFKYSHRYILCSEYYNPTPVEIEYRGNQGKLFKRDFAGEMLDMFPNLSLVDYGFIYRRAFSYPAVDDVTWFLMEKHE